MIESNQIEAVYLQNNTLTKNVVSIDFGGVYNETGEGLAVNKETGYHDQSFKGITLTTFFSRLEVSIMEVNVLGSGN